MLQTPVDLTNCDREPIHIPSSIQPHGVLIVLDDDFRVRQISANAPQSLGLRESSADVLLGKPLSELIDPTDAADLVRRIRSGPLHVHPLYIIAIHGVGRRVTFDAIAHRADGFIVVELEPTGSIEIASDDCDLYRLVHTAIANLRSSRTLLELCDGIAMHVRQLTGFDRVMVYRFDSDWNGQVIAERKADELEPFVGLNYPSSDIPRQARELYKTNWLRFIANRDYTPSPLAPANLPNTNAPLDMSFCVLRSVSPIHLEYLKNMGVGASMSISLIREGELWGLIACHHYSPRRVPFAVRSASELLGQTLSLQVAAREQAEILAERQGKPRLIERIVGRVDPGESFARSLTIDGAELMSLVRCGGAAVVDGDEVERVGQTPAPRDIIRIAERLRSVGSIARSPAAEQMAEQTFVRPAQATDAAMTARAEGPHDAPENSEGDVFETENLGALMGEAKMEPVASGVLVISLSKFGRRFILWFRPERVRTVHWAGDPQKSIVKGDGDEVRLSPRGSFALWKQTVRGRSEPFTAAERLDVHELRRRIVMKLLAHSEEISRHNALLRRSSDEKEQQLEQERAARSEAERLNRMKDEFVAMLSHELRTPLNAIQGWSQLLQQQADQSPETVREGMAVIERNARVQTQMIEDLLDISRITSGKMSLDVQPLQLHEVIGAAIDTVRFAADAKSIKIYSLLDAMPGLTVTGDPKRLQQVFWNLLSNAVKFTAKGGRVRVELKRVASHVEIGVNDNGEGIAREFLPHVFDRFRQADSSSSRRHGGLGLGLAIVRHLVEMHGGTVSVESGGKDQGSTFTVTLPVRALQASDDASSAAQSGRSGIDECEALNLKGVNVLVVDDEADSRELVRRFLVECAVNVRTASSTVEALAILHDHTFDVMITDIGMPGEDGYSLIRQVRELESRQSRPKMPAVALTAYARPEDRRKSMLAGFQVHTSKPIETSELLAVVASLAGRV